MFTTIRFPARTVGGAVADQSMAVFPSRKGVIHAGGVEFCVTNVCFARERVDLQQGSRRIYLVEHAAAMCAIFGIHSAAIYGTEREWNYKRPSHRLARENGDSPQSVLGRSDGRICYAFKRNIPRAALQSKSVEFRVVLGKKAFTDEFGNRVELWPARECEKITIQCHHGHYCAETHFSVVDGVSKEESRERIGQARSVAVVGAWSEEAVWHALGDVLGDLVGLGKLSANISVEVSAFYHNATIGCLRQLMQLEPRKAGSAPEGRLR